MVGSGEATGGWPTKQNWESHKDAQMSILDKIIFVTTSTASFPYDIEIRCFKKQSLATIHAQMKNLEITKPRRVESERVLNAHGIRGEYLRTRNDAQLLEDYRAWRDTPIWLMFMVLNSMMTEVKRYFAVRGMKRGDRRHSQKAQISFCRAYKMKQLIRQQPRTKKTPARTNCIWADLTYDGSVGSEAYGYIGQDLNRFISAMKKRYGKMLYCRVWESQKRGTPHVHILMVFLERTFPWIWMRSRKGKRGKVPRVLGHKEIKKYWPHGFANIQAVDDFEGAVKYISKYMTKQLESRTDEDDMACAHQMVYYNQTYHVPSIKNIVRAIDDPDLIQSITNSNQNTSTEDEITFFVGTFHSYEPFHRTHIFRIHVKEQYICQTRRNHIIESVEFLYEWEMPYDDGLEQEVLQ